jgi:hypothetical protein
MVMEQEIEPALACWLVVLSGAALRGRTLGLVIGVLLRMALNLQWAAAVRVLQASRVSRT